MKVEIARYTVVSKRTIKYLGLLINAKLSFSEQYHARRMEGIQNAGMRQSQSRIITAMQMEGAYERSLDTLAHS